MQGDRGNRGGQGAVAVAVPVAVVAGLRYNSISSTATFI